MPEIKITDLPLATSVASTDLCVVVADPSTTPTTKKTLASTLPVSTAVQNALNLKANLAAAAFTSSPTSNTGSVDSSTTQIATQAFVIGQAGTATPVVDSGIGLAGSSSRYSRQDHVHPTDSSRAPTANPIFTGLVTTAGQIKFPSTPNLSSDVNTLDDYEEGIWTPLFSSSSSPPSVSYNTTRYGIYVKIGKTVFISGTVSLISASGGSGNLLISGLPYTAASDTTGGLGSLALGLRSGWTTTTPGTAYVQNATTLIILYNESASAAITTANLGFSSYIQFNGFYITTATT